MTQRLCIYKAAPELFRDDEVLFQLHGTDHWPKINLRLMGLGGLTKKGFLCFFEMASLKTNTLNLEQRRF